MKRKLYCPLWVFDLGTTGVNTSKDRIVELAITKLFPDGVKIKIHTYLNLGEPIPSEASAVHAFSFRKFQC